MRCLFEENDALDVVFHEMKERNFDHLQIGKMARKLLIEQISDSQTIAKKIEGLQLGEDVQCAGEKLSDYATIALDDTDVDLHSLEVLKVLQWSKDQIIKDRQSLNIRKTQMTNSQKKVFDYITLNSEDQLLAFVTDRGGCGKSFLLHTFVLHFEFNGHMIKVLGTTGNAALLVNGKTIHSFFQLDPELNSKMEYRDCAWEAVAATDVLIIDEISMMTADILEKISNICIQTAPASKKSKLF